jgi:hypothetical protein
MNSISTCSQATRVFSHLALCALCVMAAWSGIAAAQSYPSKPVHIVVPFAPGGITDILARALAQRLTESLGQQVVVENKPGATGQVGAEAVAKAAPDGYTLLVAADATFVTNPHFYSRLAFDALNDFAPITGLGISPQALIVNPALPVRTLDDLIALARKQPGEINYGTFGIGSSGHLNIVLLEERTGTKFTPGRGARDHRRDRGPYSVDDREHWPYCAALAKRSAQGPRLRKPRTPCAISRCADARGERPARLPGRLLVRAGGAQGNAAGDHQSHQRANPAHLR